MASYMRFTDKETASEQKILVVGENLIISRFLSQTLSNYGFMVRHATSWSDMVACLQETNFHIVLMEQRLGRMDMVHNLDRILSLTRALLIFLANNPSEADRILALELGATDFLQKPMSGREIVARIRAHLRGATAPPQAATQQQTAWRMAGIERRLYAFSGTKVPLTGAEFSLLEHLVRAAGRPMARDRLTQEVLQRPYRAEDRSIDNLVYQVRQKVGRAGGGDTIIAVRGQGYAFIGFERSPPEARSITSGENVAALRVVAGQGAKR